MNDTDCEIPRYRKETATDAADAADGRWMERAWERGSYSEIESNYLSIAGRLVDRAGVDPGESVLDVGCGTGSVAITAARRGAEVAGIDITPSMLEEAKENAELAGVDATWRRGDAADLPVESDGFDVTLSSLGHMYGDPPGAVAEELLRVTRSGGRIGFTSWTPTSLYPAMAGIVATHLSPEDLPDFTEPPFAWGDADVVEDRLGDGVEDLELETRTVAFPALSPAHFWRETATTSGTFLEALDRVDDDRRALRERLVETIEPYFDDEENAVELEYRLATATVAGDG